MTDGLLFIIGFILLGIGVLCAIAVITRNNSDESDKKNLVRAVKDIRPIAILFVAVIAFTITAAIAALNAGSITDNLLDGFKLGFASSLAEDILFFGILGLVIFVLQRNDFFKSKKFEDRIDYLFNSKDLSSEERSDLKQKISEIATDFQLDETKITIEKISPDYKWIKLDIIRKFTVKNYLDDWHAEYNFNSKIAPDTIPKELSDKGEKALVVHPVSVERNFTDKEGQIRQVGTEESLYGTYDSDGVFDLPNEKRTIAPGQTMVCILHFFGWQKLVSDNSEDAIENDSNGNILIKKPEAYKIEALRHWDSWKIGFTNKTALKINISIAQPDNTTDIELGPGKPLDDAWQADDIVAGSLVLIRFSGFSHLDNSTKN